MKIVVVGTGYVGLVTGTCFASKGNDVVCVDTDHKKIQNLLKGVLPIYEPGLDALVSDSVAQGHLRFSTSLAQTLAEQTPDMVFIAVGTPPGEDGSADLKYVLGVAGEIGASLQGPTLVIDKSTVPVGTAAKVRAQVQAELDRRGSALTFDVVSNPGFLKEGAAIDDFMNPDRVVVGVESEHAGRLMTELYLPFVAGDTRKIYVMAPKDAEMTKYAANSMLAVRITFMNELAVLCDRLGVDIDQVRQGIGSDRRIGTHFLFAGCGFGGSCFPKDVKALIHMGGQVDVSLGLLDKVEARNETQKEYLLDKIDAHFGRDNIAGKTFAMWGLAFKPGTDDMREAPSLVIIRGLLERGANVVAHDPVALETAQAAMAMEGIDASRVRLVEQREEALEGADALVVVTEWADYKAVTPAALAKSLKSGLVFDGRNIFAPAAMKAHGLDYYGIGRGR